jgi:hypothetical protein
MRQFVRYFRVAGSMNASATSTTAGPRSRRSRGTLPITPRSPSRKSPSLGAGFGGPAGVRHDVSETTTPLPELPVSKRAQPFLDGCRQLRHAEEIDIDGAQVVFDGGDLMRQ